MSKSSGRKISRAQLRDAFVADLARVWDHTLKHHPKDEPYLFALYGVEGGEFAELCPQVLTETGLTKVAQKYVDEKIHETLQESREILRYSVADSPTFHQRCRRVRRPRPPTAATGLVAEHRRNRRERP